MTRRSLTVGKDRFVVGPWHDDPTVAYLSVAPVSAVLTSRASVERCLAGLTERRTKELDAFLHCEEGDMSCPVPGQ